MGFRKTISELLKNSLCKGLGSFSREDALQMDSIYHMHNVHTSTNLISKTEHSPFVKHKGKYENIIRVNYLGKGLLMSLSIVF